MTPVECPGLPSGYQQVVMQAAPLPDNEAQRLQTLRLYDILDTDPERAFDDLTDVPSRIINAPISLVTLVDKDRQWFKSKQGLDATETPRDHAFCAHLVRDQPRSTLTG